MINPYSAPQTDTNALTRPPSRRSGWKIYAYTIILLQLATLYRGLGRIDLVRAIDYGPTMLGLIGLVGYAHRRRIFKRSVWKIHSVLLPLWDIAMGAWVYPHVEHKWSPGLVATYFILMTMFVPEYIALFRYAYKSPDIWSGASA